jgi:hypothetical protein
VIAHGSGQVTTITFDEEDPAYAYIDRFVPEKDGPMPTDPKTGLAHFCGN